MLLGLAALAVAATAGEQKGGLPQLYAPDFAPQLIWLAICFGVLFFVLSKVALPRIGEVMQERRDRIQRDLDEAGRLKTETEQALVAYEQALAEARARSGAIAKERRGALTVEIDQERARVEAQVAAKVADAEKRIAAMKSNAMTQVNEIAVDTAAAVVARLIGIEVAKDEVRRAMQPGAAE